MLTVRVRDVTVCPAEGRFGVQGKHMGQNTEASEGDSASNFDNGPGGENSVYPQG